VGLRLKEDAEPLPILGINAETRTLFHFFDPIHNTGLTFPWNNNASPSVKWAVDGNGLLNINMLLAGIPLVIQNAQFSNAYSYKSAREYLLNGLTCGNEFDRLQAIGKMFRALGQVVHLLQDCSVPEHTRNDQHLSGCLFEDIASGYTADYLHSQYTPKYSTPSEFYRGLANYTNSGFISQGTTNFPDICKIYSSPNMDDPIETRISFENLLYGNLRDPHQACLSAGYTEDECLSTVTFYGNYVNDLYYGNVEMNQKMTSYSIFDKFLRSVNQFPVYSVNRFVCKEQASFLIPHAVGYSNGLLQYFFRGSINAQFPLSNEVKIENTSDEDMSGTFELYYDATDGKRYLAPGASWSSIPINAGSISQTLNFALPNNAEEDGKYILVFNGTLGQETNCIVGSIVRGVECTPQIIIDSGSCIGDDACGIITGRMNECLQEMLGQPWCDEHCGSGYVFYYPTNARFGIYMNVLQKNEANVEKSSWNLASLVNAPPGNWLSGFSSFGGCGNNYTGYWDSTFVSFTLYDLRNDELRSIEIIGPTVFKCTL
jgi:hypothetical protein